MRTVGSKLVVATVASVAASIVTVVAVVVAVIVVVVVVVVADVAVVVVVVVVGIEVAVLVAVVVVLIVVLVLVVVVVVVVLVVESALALHWHIIGQIDPPYAQKATMSSSVDTSDMATQIPSVSVLLQSSGAVDDLDVVAVVVVLVAVVVVVVSVLVVSVDVATAITSDLHSQSVGHVGAVTGSIQNASISLSVPTRCIAMHTPAVSSMMHSALVVGAPVVVGGAIEPPSSSEPT